MAIIALKAWYLEQYEPIRETIKKPCTLRLSRNSLLKTGLRADFLDDRIEVEGSDWFERYLEGKTVEFYLQGSGTYIVSNIDLVSQEIYFTKCTSISGLEPIIYYSPQNHDRSANEAITSTLNHIVDDLSERSRIPLSLEVTPRSLESPLRLSNSQFRKITKSLLLIADVTPISSISGEQSAIPRLENAGLDSLEGRLEPSANAKQRRCAPAHDRIPRSELLIDPNVCVELGYGIQDKDNGQILLLNRSRQDLQGKMPFDMAGYKQLSFTSEERLSKSLPKLIKTLLQRYNLF